MSYRRFTIRIPEKMFREIEKIAEHNDESITEMLKILIKVGFQYYPYQEKFSEHEPLGKYNLTRAERLSIHAAIKSEILFHDICSDRKLKAAEEETRKVLENSWGYGEEKIEEINNLPQKEPW